MFSGQEGGHGWIFPNWCGAPALLPCSYGLVKALHAGVGPIPPNATLMFDLELLEAGTGPKSTQFFPQMVVGVEWCQHSFYGEVEQDTIGKKQPFYQVNGLCLVGVTGWCFLFWQEPLKSDWKKPGCWTMGQMPAKMVRCPPSTLKIVKSSFYVLTRCASSFHSW